MRSEFSAIAAGFALLPTLSGNGALPLFVNSGGTALEATSASTARIRLALGSIATQDANNVTISGGTVKGVSALTTNNATITGGTISGVGLGTMSTQNANNVAITGGTIGSAVTGTTQSQFDNSAKLATTAYADAVGMSTGDVKLTLKTVADSGWVLMDDKTIGNAASAATGRANADTVALFTLLWNNTANADCAVSTGRGVSAAADYAANKTIALPKALGRALATYGTGAGLTARALASVVGEETHTLSQAELPNVSLTTTISRFTNLGGGNTGAGGGDNGIAAGSFTATTALGGSGTAFTNMGPTLFLNVMVKL